MNLLVIDCDFTDPTAAASSQLLAVAEYFATSGDRVSLATFPSRPRQQAEMIDGLRLLEFNTGNQRLGSLNIASSLRLLWHAVLQYRAYDAIVAGNGGAFSLAATAQLVHFLRNSKLILYCSDLGPRPRRRSSAKDSAPQCGPTERFLRQTSNAIVVPSGDLADTLFDQGVAREKITTIEPFLAIQNSRPSTPEISANVFHLVIHLTDPARLEQVCSTVQQLSLFDDLQATLVCDAHIIRLVESSLGSLAHTTVEVLSIQDHRHAAALSRANLFIKTVSDDDLDIRYPASLLSAAASGSHSIVLSNHAFDLESQLSLAKLSETISSADTDPLLTAVERNRERWKQGDFDRAANQQAAASALDEQRGLDRWQRVLDEVMRAV